MNMHTHGRTTPGNRPRKPKGGVSALPAAIAEPEALQALRRLRREAQEEIDRLIAFLDATEAECDLEDGGDCEPSLGWTFSQATGDCTDLEDQCDDEGYVQHEGSDAANDPDEPSFPLPKASRPQELCRDADRRHQEAAGESMMIPMLDNTWLVMHRGEPHKVTALHPEVRSWTETIVENADDLHIAALNLTELLDQIDDVRNELTSPDGPMKQRRIDALVSIARTISLDLAERVGKLSVQYRAERRS